MSKKASRRRWDIFWFSLYIKASIYSPSFIEALLSTFCGGNRLLFFPYFSPTFVISSLSLLSSFLIQGPCIVHAMCEAVCLALRVQGGLSWDFFFDLRKVTVLQRRWAYTEVTLTLTELWGMEESNDSLGMSSATLEKAYMCRCLHLYERLRYI